MRNVFDDFDVVLLRDCTDLIHGCRFHSSIIASVQRVNQQLPLATSSGSERRRGREAERGRETKRQRGREAERPRGREAKRQRETLWLTTRVTRVVHSHDRLGLRSDPVFDIVRVDTCVYVQAQRCVRVRSYSVRGTHTHTHTLTHTLSHTHTVAVARLTQSIDIDVGKDHNGACD